jgi:hypothetical protein
MWESRANTPAIEIHDLGMLAAREDDSPAEGVAAMMVDKAGVEQQFERMTLGGEVTP